MDIFHNISGLAVEISAGLIVTALIGCLLGWFWGKTLRKADGLKSERELPKPE